MICRQDSNLVKHSPCPSEITLIWLGAAAWSDLRGQAASFCQIEQMELPSKHCSSLQLTDLPGKGLITYQGECVQVNAASTRLMG